MHKNLEVFLNVTKEMSEEEKTDFAIGLIGSLSALVDHTTWEKAVMITTTTMKNMSDK